jgi:uncharacterized DUF497 family protein
MQISYHAEKRELTLKERGLDFADAEKIFGGLTLTIEDDRHAYGETRFQTIGRLNHLIVMLVWTPRGEARHIISMRKCNAKERRNYEAQIAGL